MDKGGAVIESQGCFSPEFMRRDDCLYFRISIRPVNSPQEIVRSEPSEM